VSPHAPPPAGPAHGLVPGAGRHRHGAAARAAAARAAPGSMRRWRRLPPPVCWVLRVGLPAASGMRPAGPESRSEDSDESVTRNDGRGPGDVTELPDQERPEWAVHTHWPGSLASESSRARCISNLNSARASGSGPTGAAVSFAGKCKNAFQDLLSTLSCVSTAA
jgi:hypothetical protein